MLGAEEKASLHSRTVQVLKLLKKIRILNNIKKVVHNNLHTFMRESGDPRLEKPQRYLTLIKSYGHVTHISVFCYE